MLVRPDLCNDNQVESGDATLNTRLTSFVWVALLQIVGSVVASWITTETLSHLADDFLHPKKESEIVKRLDDTIFLFTIYAAKTHFN
jgi:hypothetical protein